MPNYEPVDPDELRRLKYPKQLLQRFNMKGDYDRSMEYEYNFDKILLFCNPPLNSMMNHPMLESGFDLDTSIYGKKCR